MKKIILTALAATLATGAAFASVVPVTEMSKDSSKIQVEYAFDQHVSGSDGRDDGFGASLSHDLSDKSALQYGYSKTNADNGDIKDHQLAYVYKVHNNVNIYGAGTYIKSGDSEFGYQGGVIGHTDLTDRIKGYAKAGFGDDIKQSYQVGAAYALKPDIDLNVYYGYDKYSIDNNDKTAKGIHAGVGYSF